MMENIIFDWSGVINDNLITVHNSVNLIFKKYGVKKISLEEFKKEWEQPYMIFYNKYIPHLSHKEEVASYIEAHKASIIQFPAKPYSYIQTTLNKFKNAKINMVVISGDPKENLLNDIKKFGLERFFKEINADVHNKVEIIEEVIKRNNFNPEETIFIGDTTHEIETGKLVKIKTAGVTWGFQNEDKIKSVNPDFVFHNLEEMESIILNFVL